MAKTKYELVTKDKEESRIEDIKIKIISEELGTSVVTIGHLQQQIESYKNAITALEVQLGKTSHLLGLFKELAEKIKLRI